MNYSALLVTSKPGKLSEMLSSLKKMQNVEVHHIDKVAGRCIVVLEAPGVGDEVEEFKKISTLESVMDCALVVHWFDDEAQVKPIQDPDKIDRIN